MSAGGGLEQNHPEGPVVCLAIDDPRQAFGRGVHQGPSSAGKALGGIKHRGNAEVDQDQLQRVSRANQNVVWLDITVHQVVGMGGANRGVQSGCDLDD